MLNVTPDSFSDGGRFVAFDAAVGCAREMLRHGADVVDVGGASSRPRGKLYGEGAPSVSLDEELHRVIPVVQALVAELGASVSVDTVQPEVARQALAAGATIINDVSNGASRPLLEAVAEAGASLVLMHTRGDGAVEPPNTDYGDLVGEVLAELDQAVGRARAAGVAAGRIWIDPGIGFAKTASQSLELLARTEAFVATGLPVLVGPSRKGFIADVAPDGSGQRPGPAEREGGTAAAVTVAVLGGAQAVRVHDVPLMRQALLVADAMRLRRKSRLPAVTPSLEARP